MNQDIHALAQVVREAQQNETLWREQQAEAEAIIAELRCEAQNLRDQVEGLEQDLDFWKRKALRHAKTIQRMESGEL